MFGIALTSLGSLSQAEEVNNLLLFGDSYFDTQAGNALAEQLSLPLPNPTPPWYDGRHSDGPNWVDDTSQLLDVTVNNFAVSGSTTGTTNVGVTGLGGMTQQIQRWEALTPFVLPGTLVILDGAGNDFLGLLANPLLINPALLAATTQQALTNQANHLTQIVGLGAKKTIIWNLGDMSKLPIFTDPTFGTTALIPAYHAASVGYNTALEGVIQQVNELAPDHQQVFIFDAYSVFNEIEADFVAQGINVTEHTMTTTSLSPFGYILPLGPQPENIAFFDQVHPTAFLWREFSKYMGGYIDSMYNGPRFIAAERDVIFESRNAFRDAQDNHFRTLTIQRYLFGNQWDNCCDPCNTSCCWDPNLLQYYFNFDAKWGSTTSREGTLGFYYDTQVIQGGADYHLNDCWTLGSSFTYQRNYAHLRDHRGHIDLDDYIPTIYAVYTACDYFVDASFSYHFYDFKRLKRRVPFIDRTAKASTHGNGYEFDLEAGYVYQCGCTTFVPLVGLDYEHINIDRYREKHAGLFDLSVHRQHDDSLISKVGGQFFWNGFDCGILPFGELFYEHEFLRAGRTIGPRFHQSNDNAIIYNHTSTPYRDVLKFAFGVEANLTPCVTGNISYEGETTFVQYNNTLRLEFDTIF